MAVGDIYQAQVFYNIGSELTMNVVHLKETVASTDDIPAETVGKVVRNNWDTWFSEASFSNGASVVLIQVRRIKPTAGVPSTLVLGSGAFPTVIGTGVGAPVPSQTAGLISFYTSVFTRNGRGRIYIPGLSKDAQNDGQLLETAIDDLQAAADIFEATQVAVGPGTGEWVYAVYSRELGTAQPITQAVPHSNMATQRGRRNFPGIGA